MTIKSPYLVVFLFSLFLTGCILDDLKGDNNKNNDLTENLNECEPDCENPNAIYAGYKHWEHFTPNLSDATAVSIMNGKLMKITHAGELGEAFTNDAGESYGVSVIHRSHDDMIYLGATVGCTDDKAYCQCAIIEINPATDAAACAYQPTQEYKWSISRALYKMPDNTLIANIARGDNSGEEILSIKDGAATVAYTNADGILNVFPMNNGGVFVVPATDNMGHGNTLYIPKAGGTPITVSDTSISSVLTHLNGTDDTYYYITDDNGYHKFDPVSETLATPVYMGKTFYSATGYINIYYNIDGDYYQGYEETDTQYITPITIPVADITAHTATIVLTSDQHLALSSPQMPLFTIKVDDQTGATENWTLTNWGIHKFDLPNVPTKVNLGLSALTNVREIAPANGQSAVLLGGSSNDPYYLKLYYPDGGSGALSIDMMQGVIDGNIRLDYVKYDQTQHQLLFYVTKITDDGESYYIGVSNYTVSDATNHSGSFSTVKLLPTETGAYSNSGFVFMP
ncbi:MAG: hypothetical protein OEX19_07620 [Gammaproteobacteria bacterium]|nr:hypothetical protein [Gammaproteobacteria bacterium]